MITVVNATFYGKEKPQLVPLQDQPKYKDVRYVAYTNNANLVNEDVWEVRIVNPEDSLRKKAREIKTNIHKFVPDTDYWLWIDNNCKLQVDPHKLLTYITDCDIAVMPHPERNNIVEEAKTLVKWKPEQSSGLEKQINSYYSEGYVPTDLYETKVLLRKNTSRVVQFNELWWEQVKHFSIRDQISFPYTSWKTKTFINTFPGNNSLSEYRLVTKPYIPYWGDIIRV